MVVYGSLNVALGDLVLLLFFFIFMVVTQANCSNLFLVEPLAVPLPEGKYTNTESSGTSKGGKGWAIGHPCLARPDSLVLIVFL